MYTCEHETNYKKNRKLRMFIIQKFNDSPFRKYHCLIKNNQQFDKTREVYGHFIY